MSLFVLWVALLVLTSGVVLGDAPRPYPPTGVPANTDAYEHNIQTGYEGYLISDDVEDEGDPEEAGLLSLLGSLSQNVQAASGRPGGGHTALTPQPWWLFLPLLSKFAFPLAVLFKPFSLILLGGAFTVGVCVFTPICTLTFLGFGVSRESVRTFLTQDRLASLTTFVTDAINKYGKLQKKNIKKEQQMRKFSALFRPLFDMQYKIPEVDTDYKMPETKDFLETPSNNITEVAVGRAITSEPKIQAHSKTRRK